jgi:hypothetical protein
MATALPILALLRSGGYSRWPFDLTAIAYPGMARLVGWVFRTITPPDAQAKNTREAATAGKPVDHPAAMPRLFLAYRELSVVVVEMQFESSAPLDCPIISRIGPDCLAFWESSIWLR